MLSITDKPGKKDLRGVLLALLAIVGFVFGVLKFLDQLKGTGFTIIVVIGVILIISIVITFFDFNIPESSQHFSNVNQRELKNIIYFCKSYLPEVPTVSQVKPWHKKNPRSIYVGYRSRGTFSKSTTKINAIFSLIPLTDTAVALIEQGQLNGLSLNAEHVAAKGEQIGAIYIGAIAANGRMARAETLGYVKSKLDEFRGQGIKKYFTRPTTSDGVRLCQKYGFEPIFPGVTEIKNQLCKIEFL